MQNAALRNERGTPQHAQNRYAKCGLDLIVTLNGRDHRPFEHIDKIDVFSEDKRNRCGKTLLCVFPPIPLFEENQLRKRLCRCLPLVFFQRSHIVMLCMTAAHVRLRDTI